MSPGTSQKIGTDYIVKDRMRQQEMNFRMIEIEKWVSFLLLFFIPIIASFNIISSLSMLVLEKQSSLSTLSAMGMNRRQIGKVFFWESIFVSLAGGISGIATGIILVFLQERFGLIKIAGGGAITAYPVALEGGATWESLSSGGCHRCCHCCHHRHLRPLAHKLTRQSINPSIHQPVNPPNTFSKMSAQRYFLTFYCLFKQYLITLQSNCASTDRKQ